MPFYYPVYYCTFDMMDVTLMAIHHRRLCCTLVSSLTTANVHRDISL